MESDDETTAVRQRPRPSGSKILYRAGAQGRHSVSGRKTVRQAQENPLLSRAAGDIWKLIQTVLTLPAHLYLVLKWTLLIYIAWMIITHLMAFIHSATETLAPICSIQIVRSHLPFCTGFYNTDNRVIDVSRVATTQEQLIVVVDRVGVNFDLARDMVDHEFAVRDLRIRVAASGLARRKELTHELDSLSRYTEQTAKDLSLFTAIVGKTIDKVKIFDDYAVNALEDIAEGQRNSRTLSSRLISVLISILSPFAAFRIADADYTEEQVKHICIDTATRISDIVKLLLGDAFSLFHSLDKIKESLRHINSLSQDERLETPEKDVLSALWSRLARPDDYVRYKSHNLLLKDLAGYYDRASDVMKETIAALNRIEGELKAFRDEYAIPGLTMKDEPLKIVVASLRKAGQRLEAGKTILEEIEGGGRQQMKELPSASRRTVTLKQA